MKYRKVGIDLDFLSKHSSEKTLLDGFKSLEHSFLLFGTLKRIISNNNKVFQSTQRGQNGKSDTAKSIINNGFTLPKDFILAKSEILKDKVFNYV